MTSKEGTIKIVLQHIGQSQSTNKVTVADGSTCIGTEIDFFKKMKWIKLKLLEILHHIKHKSSRVWASTVPYDNIYILLLTCRTRGKYKKDKPDQVSASAYITLQCDANHNTHVSNANHQDCHTQVLAEPLVEGQASIEAWDISMSQNKRVTTYSSILFRPYTVSFATKNKWRKHQKKSASSLCINTFLHNVQSQYSVHIFTQSYDIHRAAKQVLKLFFDVN